jgi:hypothetical protein
MAVNFLLIPNGYPYGVDETLRSMIIEGQVLPYNSTNPILNITSVSLSANVVTFTCANALTAGGGQTVFVAGFPTNGPNSSLAFLNGSYTTTAATTTTFTAALTHANLAATQCLALATLAPNYATGGLPLAWFTDVRTGKAQPIAGIGPLALPTSVSIFSLSGSLQSYVAKYTGAGVNIVDQKGGTEATNAAAVPADSIGFYMEWQKGAF